jgi:hypothetical protein
MKVDKTVIAKHFSEMSGFLKVLHLWVLFACLPQSVIEARRMMHVGNLGVVASASTALSLGSLCFVAYRM